MAALSALLVSATTGMTAFAATPPSPSTMTSYANCQAAMGADNSNGSNKYTNADIKAWGLARVNARSASLDKYNVLRSSAVAKAAKYDTQLAPDASLQKTINAIENVKTKLSQKGATIDPQYNFTAANISPARLSPPSAIGNMNSVFNNARTVISSSSSTLNSSNPSRGGLINAACKSVFDAQVYNVVLPTVKVQYVHTRLDGLSAKNAVYQAAYNGILSIDSAKKSKNPNYADGTTIQADINSLKNPAEVSAMIQQTANATPGTPLKTGVYPLSDRLNAINQKINSNASQSNYAKILDKVRLK